MKLYHSTTMMAHDFAVHTCMIKETMQQVLNDLLTTYDTNYIYIVPHIFTCLRIYDVKGPVLHEFIISDTFYSTLV
jgi:hypothetical protein